MSRKSKSIALPTELYSAIEKRLGETDIDSVEAYVVFVMQEVIRDEDPLAFTQEDDEQVRQRLRELGYLD